VRGFLAEYAFLTSTGSKSGSGPGMWNQVPTCPHKTTVKVATPKSNYFVFPPNVGWGNQTTWATSHIPSEDRTRIK